MSFYLSPWVLPGAVGGNTFMHWAAANSHLTHPPPKQQWLERGVLQGMSLVFIKRCYEKSPRLSPSITPGLSFTR